MRIKRVAVFVLFAVVLYTFFKINQPACQSCKNEPIQIIGECEPVRSSYTTTYNRLSCFCDKPSDWRKLSWVIRQMSYTKSEGGVRHSTNIFGIKNIACGDDELQYEVFDDDEVFLYMVQDTSKAVYDGALKEMYINDVVANKRMIGLLDVGKNNRKIVRQINDGIVIEYLVEYDELNSHALISFQQAIQHDSTYQKRFKDVQYQLIRKQNGKHEATIRYEKFGERFYLNIL